MKTAIQIFLKQTRRSTKRLILQLMLLCAAVAFFVVSLNLYSNSIRNLQVVENAYTTIVTAEFYGDVTADGTLVHPGDEACVGRYLLSVEDYDFSPFLALDSVKDIHLRTRVGAYIPGHIPVSQMNQDNPRYPADYKTLSNTGDVIRFVLDTEEPLTFTLQNNGWKYHQFPIRILEQSNPLLEYPDEYALGIPILHDEAIDRFADDIRRLNRSDATDTITLYPGVEYVLAACNSGDYWSRDPETGKYVWREDNVYRDKDLNTEVRYQGIGLTLAGFRFYETNSLCYDPYFGLYSTDTPYPPIGPFALQRYEDVKDDPDWAEYVQAGAYNSSSFTAIRTNDISLVPAWYKGCMFLNEGRMITEEEYKSGAKVCMVSARMALQQGWQVGDKLELHLYEYNGFYDVVGDSTTKEDYLPAPVYLKDCGGFFEEDTYEIVGIFGQLEPTDIGETAEDVFANPWDAFYIPANASPNAPKGPVQASLLTIHLKNGSADAFQAAVEEMGLTEQKTGKYEIKFSYFDQGYDKIKGGLEEMNRNAELLLGLSAVLLMVTMILMAFLFAQQHKHSAGILRLLGGSKKQAFIAILTCAAIVVLVGGMIGAVLGGALTQSVGESTLGDATESATVALHVGASPVLTALCGIGCVALFLLLTAIFTATYIGKEPRALLPEDKG